MRRGTGEYAGRARTEAEKEARKEDAIRVLTDWATTPARLALLYQRFPLGPEHYPAHRLLSAIGPLRACGHFVLVDGKPEPPPDETESQRIWRGLWGNTLNTTQRAKTHRTAL